MDWTTIGAPPPTATRPTSTATERCRGAGAAVTAGVSIPFSIGSECQIGVSGSTGPGEGRDPAAGIANIGRNGRQGRDWGMPQVTSKFGALNGHEAASDWEPYL